MSSPTANESGCTIELFELERNNGNRKAAVQYSIGHFVFVSLGSIRDADLMIGAKLYCGDKD